MKTTFLTAALSLALSAQAAFAAVVHSDEGKDWKYSVGWDGSTLPASDIGIPAPTNATTSTLEKRTVGGVYICTDINWDGTCGYAVQPLKECIVLGSDWDKKISSFGPDSCTSCNAFESNNCTFFIGSGSPTAPPEWNFQYPGDATGGLGTDNPWNDRISSFICSDTC